jgi:cell division protein FtsI/penicillin-binding protein 2
VSSLGRQNRPGRNRIPEASYDEASRRRRAQRTIGAGKYAGPEGSPKVVLYVFAAFALIVIGKLLWLQVITAPSLKEEAQNSITNVVTVHAKRGTIYDRNGNVLAMSVDCKDIVADPQQVEKVSETADILVEVLGGDKSEYEEKLNRDSRYALIASQVDDSVADELKEKLNEAGLSGMYYNSNTKRVYPYGSTGAQIIGHVNSEGTAQSGLEYYYDEILKGTDGTKIYEAGSGGSPMAGGASEVNDAQDGTDIVLSIDIDLQAECETIAAEATETYASDSSSIMVTNPKTGEIYAACSTPLPDFDNLTDISSLNLKLVTDSYEPGSVFKVLTTSIGFDLGLFTPETTYNVPWSYQVGDDYVTDDDGRDYDEDMTVRYMLLHSSNPAMAMLVQEHIGAKAFSEGVAKFGIGTKTGIDFPGETSGIVKSYDEYDGSTAGSMAFGQGVAIPMVQIVRAYASVANKGTLTTPHFLISKGGEEVEWADGGQTISEEAAEQEIDIMRSVMTDGTGTNGQVEGYDIAGKTGTGEQADSSGTYGAYNYVASLCGFANASDPEVLVYTGLNGTAHLALSSAANVFHDVMEKSVTILGIAPVQ